MSVIRKWSLMAAVVAVAIAMAGWFLLIGPKRSEAAQIREKTAAEEASNASLLQQLEVLKAQQAELPAQRAKLAVMRKQIPDNPALPTLIRNLSKAGRQVGVSIDSMTPAVPAPMALAVAAPVVTTPATTEETAEGDAAAEATTPAAPVAPPAPSLYQVPLSVTVTGSYFELEQFVNNLEEMRRSFLVAGFTLNPAGEAGATDSGDGPAPGDLTLVLQGRVFMAPAGAAVAAATQPTPVTSPASGQ